MAMFRTKVREVWAHKWDGRNGSQSMTAIHSAVWGAARQLGLSTTTGTESILGSRDLRCVVQIHDQGGRPTKTLFVLPGQWVRQALQPSDIAVVVGEAALLSAYEEVSGG